MHGKGEMMQMQKRNSTYLTETAQEKQPDEALRQNIIEDCREMWDVHVDTEREFHPLEEEIAHATEQANDSDKR